MDWLGGVVSGATDLGGTIIKGAFNLAGGTVAAGFRLAGGVLTLDFSLFKKGLKTFGDNLWGAILLIGGAALTYIQMFFGISHKRALTDTEKEVLRRVYRNSLSLYNVRVIEGNPGVFSPFNTPFTIGNTIHARRTDFEEEPDELVHEGCHVWQYQHRGVQYANRAIARRAPDRYDWEWDLIVLDKSTWSEFHPEAQAAFLTDLWEEGRTADTFDYGDGVFYRADPVDGKVEFKHFFHNEFYEGSPDYGTYAYHDHTEFSRKTVGYVRGAFVARWSPYPTGE
jgi:hypothetical protein